jgi:hypothetical protein
LGVSCLSQILRNTTGAIPAGEAVAHSNITSRMCPGKRWTSHAAGFEGDVSALYGAELGRILQRPPDSAFIADGSPVIVFKGEKIP